MAGGKKLSVLLLVLALAGCDGATQGTAEPGGASRSSAPAPATTGTPSRTPASSAPAPSSTATPAAWQVGAHPLPLRPDGFGQVLPTPAPLVNRALPSVELLPPPAGNRYAATSVPASPAVLARSTWQPACPVAAAKLRYLTMSFWGFDGRAHTGEMLVNASAASDITRVFGELFAARFPIEEMRVTRADELDAAPTGDGNNTSAFVCRPVRGQRNWSAHAYGLAVDLDPFCNPYVKGDLVLPELASAYTGRNQRKPGMVHAGDATVRAFAAVGWSWGGSWTSPKDIMHFSATGG